MPIVTVHPSREVIYLAPDETVLSGLYKAGYAYAVGCRRGGCAGTEVGTHNPESFPRHLVGVGVPAIDHALITAADVKGMERFLTEAFGF